jgi:hypothetical protein
MSFDPMAAVVDWLDAYRSGDLESILGLYSDIATIDCGCGGATTINGRDALRAYWEQRLRDSPAADLDDLQPARDGVAITYSATAPTSALTLNLMLPGRSPSRNAAHRIRGHSMGRATGGKNQYPSLRHTR